MKSSHLWLLVLAFFSALSAAQSPTTMSTGTSGGLTTITVRVSYQQSHRPAAAMRVELVSPYGGMVDTRTTDGNGAATFNSISNGHDPGKVRGPDGGTTTSDLI